MALDHRPQREVKQKIATRYLIAIISLLVVLQIILVGVQSFLSFTDDQGALEEKVINLTSFIVSVSSESLLTLDFNALETLMRQANQDTDVVYSVILDTEEQPLTRYLNRENPLIAEIVETEVEGNILSTIERIKQQSTVREVRSPIFSEGELLGWVRLGFSSARIWQELQGTVIVGLTIAALISLILIIVTGMLFNRWITTPLQKLVDFTHRVTEGDLDQRLEIQSDDEIGILTESFNQMTDQLSEMVTSLEDRVASRTHHLEIAASLSEQLSAILDFNLLLSELVNRVKEAFDYYHAHVYIIDEKRENLVMTAGAGEPGKKMKASGHHIPLNAPTSLVALAARSGEIVRVDNVREAEDWLPNPLLPDTYSEMAVPIILNNQVVGVLDVQEDEIAGLDAGDVGLLRSLANQVAVAIRNARLFEEVETALAQAQAVEAQYLEQTWEKTRVVRKVDSYLYVRPGAPDLSQSVVAEADNQAITRDAPASVALNDGQTRSKSIVAPVKLGKKAIGTLQLHRVAAEGQAESPWTEEDLAVVEAVLDQVAQTAENLRLFESTRERAGLEQTIREITDELRTAPNLDILLETAARELGRRLGVPQTVLELGIDSDPSSSLGNGQHSDE